MSLTIDATKKAFLKAATAEKNGVKFLSKEDFRNLVLKNVSQVDLDKNTLDQGVSLLFALADKSNQGMLSLEDFLVFENLMSSPDAEYQLAYRLFDLDGDGKVSQEEFKTIVSNGASAVGIQLDFSSDWFKLYVDPNSTEITYHNFSQLLKSVQLEKLKQSFKLLDPEGKGSVSAESFAQIFRSVQKHKLTNFISTNLPTVENLFQGRPVTYATVVAFNNVLHELDFVDHVVREISSMHPGGFTREEFITTARTMTRFSRFSPLEFDLLFHFASLENKSGKYHYRDFEKLLDPQYDQRHSAHPIVKTQELGVVGNVFKQVYSFALGSVAGAIGATFVYPIDLVKTRMQNQRKVVGEVLYKNSWDCFRKVLKNEGFRGLYRGLGPQLIGVAPEKAIKLTMNDLMRGLLKNKETGEISLLAEIVSGGVAGGCQVIFTNPLEIVKIRLQVQGELAAKGVEPYARTGAIHIVRSLGLMGLYKGATACLLRDIPFSAIYFSVYAHIKKAFGETPESKLSGAKLLLSGALAGMPAAYLCTPADVIKTRLQVEARKGEQTYKGIRDAAVKIFKQEGWTAFFKGGPARVFRSSPQFGVTLLSYEILQRNFPFPDGSGDKQQSSGIARWTSANPTVYDTSLNVLRTQYAFKLLMDIDYKFGVWPALPVKALPQPLPVASTETLAAISSNVVAQEQ